MLRAGVILSDYATLMVEILKDNARPEAAAVYGAMDMPWAKLVGQIAQADGKSASRRSRTERMRVAACSCCQGERVGAGGGCVACS